MKSTSSKKTAAVAEKVRHEWTEDEVYQSHDDQLKECRLAERLVQDVRVTDLNQHSRLMVCVWLAIKLLPLDHGRRMFELECITNNLLNIVNDRQGSFEKMRDFGTLTPAYWWRKHMRRKHRTAFPPITKPILTR